MQTNQAVEQNRLFLPVAEIIKGNPIIKGTTLAHCCPFLSLCFYDEPWEAQAAIVTYRLCSLSKNVNSLQY